MKIITIDTKNPYIEYFYDTIEFYLNIGNTYLPFIFMKLHVVNAEEIKLPKWITEREWNILNKKTQKFAKNNGLI